MLKKILVFLLCSLLIGPASAIKILFTYVSVCTPPFKLPPDAVMERNGHACDVSCKDSQRKHFDMKEKHCICRNRPPLNDLINTNMVMNNVCQMVTCPPGQISDGINCQIAQSCLELSKVDPTKYHIKPEALSMKMAKWNDTPECNVTCLDRTKAFNYQSKICEENMCFGGPSKITHLSYNESDAGCGDSYGLSRIGKSCNGNSDCLSHICLAGICTYLNIPSIKPEFQEMDLYQ